MSDEPKIVPPFTQRQLARLKELAQQQFNPNINIVPLTVVLKELAGDSSTMATASIFIRLIAEIERRDDLIEAALYGDHRDVIEIAKKEERADIIEHIRHLRDYYANVRNFANSEDFVGSLENLWVDVAGEKDHRTPVSEVRAENERLRQGIREALHSYCRYRGHWLSEELDRAVNFLRSLIGLPPEQPPQGMVGGNTITQGLHSGMVIASGSISDGYRPHVGPYPHTGESPLAGTRSALEEGEEIERRVYRWRGTGNSTAERPLCAINYPIIQDGMTVPLRVELNPPLVDERGQLYELEPNDDGRTYRAIPVHEPQEFQARTIITQIRIPPEMVSILRENQSRTNLPPLLTRYDLFAAAGILDEFYDDQSRNYIGFRASHPTTLHVIRYPISSGGDVELRLSPPLEAVVGQRYGFIENENSDPVTYRAVALPE